MMITSKGHSGLDIWQKTPNQGIGTEEIISTTWYKRVMKQSVINLQQYHPLIPCVKKTRYTSYTSSN